MIQYLIVFAFFVLALVFFGATLHLTKYKKRTSGCCGGGHCDSPEDENQESCGCYEDKVNFVENYEKISDCGSSCSCTPDRNR